MIIKRVKPFAGRHALDWYLWSSFAASLILLMGRYTLHGVNPFQSIFTHTFFIGSIFYLTKGLGNSTYIKKSRHFPLLYLFQVFSLIGISFEWETNSGLYLIFVPCVSAGLISLSSEKEIKKKFMWFAPGLLLFGLCCYVLFHSYSGVMRIPNQEEIITFCALSFWCLGTFYWHINVFKKTHKRIVGALLKGNRNTNTDGNEEFMILHPDNDEDREHKDRFFFHDVINHTHSMSLFLKFKVNAKIHISVEESQSLIQELNTLQSLIKDHFGLKHKNLSNTLNVVPFYMAKEGIDSLVQNFLNPSQIITSIDYEGDLIASKNLDATVHYPTFYRVLTNLIKNISESTSKEVYILFHYDLEGLKIILKNKILNLKDQEEDLECKLEDIILNESKLNDSNDKSGLGMESIIVLCEGQGGSYDFKIEGDYWVSNVFLPNPKLIKKISEAA